MAMREFVISDALAARHSWHPDRSGQLQCDRCGAMAKVDEGTYYQLYPADPVRDCGAGPAMLDHAQQPREPDEDQATVVMGNFGDFSVTFSAIAPRTTVPPLLVRCGGRPRRPSRKPSTRSLLDLVPHASAGAMSNPMANDPDLLDEYDFSNAEVGKYAKAYAEGTNVVLLDADVAAVFKTSQAVNDVLRDYLRRTADGA